MANQKLREMLKGNYSILNSEENPELCPDRDKIIRPSDYVESPRGKQFRFGHVADFHWFDGIFDFPPYTIQDSRGGAYFYSRRGDDEQLKVLQDRLDESIIICKEYPPCIVTGDKNIEFYLTLIDQKMKRYIPSEQEIDELIQVLQGDAAFLEQVAAIEILSNSDSIKAYYHLNILTDYNITLESDAKKVTLFPAFDMYDYWELHQTWVYAGRPINGKVKINFTNVHGPLKEKLDRIEEPDFYHGNESSRAENNKSGMVFMRCRLWPDFWNLYCFIFNAPLRVRRNLGESFDKETELRKISFF